MPPSPRADWPVFLVGCHRSGTTLTRYLLDAHPRLACPPESKFIAGFEAFLSYPQALNGLASMGISPETIVRELGRITTAFMGEYAAAHGKPRWVDKTPNYYRLLPLIDAMLDTQVLFLLVVRHPFDTIDSLADAAAFNVERPDDPDIRRAREKHGRGREGWARHWVEVNRTAFEFCTAVQDRSHWFRYEDLVRSPEPTLTQILESLGETMPEGLLASAFTQSHTPGYHDWKIDGTTAIHQDSVDKWRAWPAAEIDALWAIVGDTARLFGYEPPVPVDPAGRRPSRAARTRVRSRPRPRSA